MGAPTPIQGNLRIAGAAVHRARGLVRESGRAIADRGLAASRIDGIDVVRGALMIAITWSHALINIEPGHRRMVDVARLLLSGTVGFTTVSGLLVGWFAVVKRDRYRRVSRRYLVQAARFAFVVHPIVALALFQLAHVPLPEFAARSLFITDTLCVLFVAIVPFVPRLAPRLRLGAGVLFIAIDAVSDLYDPANPAVRLLHELLFGVESRPHILLSNYGILPLAGMFLVGTWLGERLARAQENGSHLEFARGLVPAAVALGGVSAALVAAWLAVRGGRHPALTTVLFPSYETTLYPFHLATTLLLLSLALRARLDHPTIRAAALLGKTSLFVYVVQYFLVETMPGLLGWSHAEPPLAVAALCAAVVPMLLVAGSAWNRWVKHV